MVWTKIRMRSFTIPRETTAKRSTVSAIRRTTQIEQVRRWLSLICLRRKRGALLAVWHENGVFSHMTTDHYHYFHLGWENYHALLSSWGFIRGKETDVWSCDLGRPIEREHYGQDEQQYERNRHRFHSEADYPSLKTLRYTADRVEEHHADDNWLLLADYFDPHTLLIIRRRTRRRTRTTIVISCSAGPLAQAPNRRRRQSSTCASGMPRSSP